MNFYSIAPLFASLLFLLLGIFCLSVSKIRREVILFTSLCFVTFIWQFSWFILFNTTSDKIASLVIKIGYTGIIFIPIAYFHFMVSFLKIENYKVILRISYAIAFILVILLWTSKYFVNGYYKFYWGYYPKAGLLHPLHLLQVFTVTMWMLYLLWNSINKFKLEPMKYNQLKYVMLGILFYFPAASDYLVNYGVEFYPKGFISLSIFAIITTYAIIRYRLMDLKIAVTRIGIFILVYTLLLGLPFAVAVGLKGWLVDKFGPGWWMFPLILMAVLATVGPFIYIFLQKKAEDRLLREQRKYQETLKQASVGMTRIRNLDRLLDLIAHIVTKTVKISYAAIYLYNKDTNEYVLQVSRDKGRIPIPKVNPINPLVAWIMVEREPLIYEEVKRKMEDAKDETCKLLEENMRLLTATVIIPSFLEDKFIGFFVLGDKLSGQIYTPDDLNVFQVLASQAALAIENAQFYEDAKEMQEQIAQAEKMATIGTMADGLSHQINNRFYALSLIAGDTIDTIKTTDTTKCTPEVRTMIDEINHALERIQTNVMQGGEVVKGILKYSKKGSGQFEALDLDAIIDNTLEMVQYKVKLSEIDLVRDYKDIPKIKGNMTQLQEVFFNFIDNAYDAIVERRTTLKEDGYRGRIIISARPKDKFLEIIVEDNGMGVKDFNNTKIFTPFFTTKTSSNKGTGLGLYVIKRIITDTHKGTISFESKHGIGTRFILELLTAK